MWGGNARFEVRRRLGEGGMGVVYEAYDRERKMPVAIKTLRHVNPAAVYRFKREFRLLSGVSHPNLISLYELISVDDQWMFTMELVDGVDFVTYVCGPRQTMATNEAPTRTIPGSRRDATEPSTVEATTPAVHGRFDLDKLRDALVQLSEGVAALHDSGHLHQDIKPSNVLVTRHGRVVLLDFGVITELGAADWRRDVEDRGGTPAYMAPERYDDDRSASEASDWYSVGVMLYLALTGHKPFSGKPKLMLAAKRRPAPPAPRAQRLDVPDDLNDLCVALLDPEPHKRPAGAQILAQLRRTEVSAGPAPHHARAQLWGRDDELARLGGALDRTRDSATVVFVSGNSGMGKSALLHGFADDLARSGDAIVLAGRCYERETVPFKAVDNLIDALYRFLVRQSPARLSELLPGDIRYLARMFPVLEQLAARVKAPPLPIGQAAHDLRRRAFAALRELLVRITSHRSLVLIIDDLQWGDADSAALLDAIMRPPDSPPLLLIVAYRAEDAGCAAITSLLGMSSEWEPTVAAEHIVVEELDASDAQALAAHLLERSEDGSAVRSLLEEARGHPYLIHELAHFAGGAGSDSALLAQVSLERVLATRVDRLDPVARTILELVAVADRPTSQVIIEQAAAISRAERANLFRALESERLVRLSGPREYDTIAVYHNQIRETINARLDADRRRRHHGQLARALLHAEQTDPETLAAHFAGAGNDERAGYYAAVAARQAAQSLAFDRAAELFRRSLRLGDHDAPTRHELELELGHALAHAGRGTEAAEVFLAAAAVAEPLARLDHRREAARQLLVSGHIQRGLDTILTLLDDIGTPYPATPRRALVGLLWNRAFLRLGGLRWTPREAADIPAEQLARVDVEQSVADGLAMVDNIRGAYFQARALRKSLRLGEARRIARALSREAVFLSSVGGKSIARAELRLKLMREINERAGDSETRAWIHVSEGFIRYFSGRLRQAQQCFQDAELLLRAQPSASSLELTNVRLFRLFAFRRIGAFDVAQRLSDDYIRDAQRRGDLYGETSMRRACTFFWLVADRPDEAARQLSRTSWTPLNTGYHLQHWYELEADVELLLYRRPTPAELPPLEPRFEALWRSMLSRIQIVRVLGHRLQARLLLAEPVEPPARDKILAAVSRHARNMASEDIGYATAWALLLRAAVLSQRGETATAIELLAKAAAAAEATDLGADAAVARRRRGQLMGGDAGRQLVAEAEDFLAQRGVVDPEALSRVLAPGFPAR